MQINNKDKSPIIKGDPFLLLLIFFFFRKNIYRIVHIHFLNIKKRCGWVDCHPYAQRTNNPCARWHCVVYVYIMTSHIVGTNKRSRFTCKKMQTFSIYEIL